MTISEWQKTVYALAKEKGWHQSDPVERIPHMLININGEVAEAWEEFRANKGPTEIYFHEGNKPCGMPIELADVLIRVLDTAEALGIDLEEAMEIKHNYNATRPYRHGGKKA